MPTPLNILLCNLPSFHKQYSNEKPFRASLNSIRALKLSAIVPRILNKKEAFISGRFLGLCSSSLFILDKHFFDILFSPISFKVKSMKTAQMFFKTAWHQVKVQFN